jgi:hypothetical protein
MDFFVRRESVIAGIVQVVFKPSIITAGLVTRSA